MFADVAEVTGYTSNNIHNTWKHFTHERTCKIYIFSMVSLAPPRSGDAHKHVPFCFLGMWCLILPSSQCQRLCWATVCNFWPSLSCDIYVIYIYTYIYKYTHTYIYFNPILGSFSLLEVLESEGSTQYRSCS